MHAADTNNYRAAEVLLLAGADIHVKDFEGKNILHHLATNTSHILLNTDFLEVLLSRFEDVASCDSNGRTPLQWACATGHSRLARRLLEGPTLKPVDIGSRDLLVDGRPCILYVRQSSPKTNANFDANFAFCRPVRRLNSPIKTSALSADCLRRELWLMPKLSQGKRLSI